MPEKKEMEFNEQVKDTRKEMDFDANKKPIEPQKPKFTSKDYGNVRVYPNETGSNMDKNNKWIGSHYSLDKVHNIDDNYLKNNLVGKTKSGSDIYKMPDGYFSGNPRINAASFKSVQDLEDFEKKSGEHRAAMKEGSYLEDYIKNYKEPKPTQAQQLTQFVKDKIFTKENAEKAKGADIEWMKGPRFKKGDRVSLTDGNREKTNNYEIVGFYNGGNVVDENTADEFNKSYGVRVRNLDTGKEYPVSANFLKGVQSETGPEVEGLTDDELKEELYDNEYWYGSAKSVDEVAQRLVDRTKISPERAKEFASKYWKGADTWSTEAPKYDEYNDIYGGIKDVLTSGKIDLNKYKTKDKFGDVALDYNNPNLIKEVMALYPPLKDSEEVKGFIEEINGVEGEDLFSESEEPIKGNIGNRIKEERINLDLFKSKLDNYKTTGEVRSIVNGDVGNLNGLTNGELMDLLDQLNYDYELRNSPKGKTIYYIPKKK